MKSLNLKDATIKDVENFLLEATLHTTNITCEVGEFGMLMFHKLVTEWREKIGFETRNELYDKVLNPIEGQFIKYMLANGRVLLLLHNLELDLKEGQEIDDITGFPVRSNILYLKEK